MPWDATLATTHLVFACPKMPDKELTLFMDELNSSSKFAGPVPLAELTDGQRRRLQGEAM